MKEPSNIPAAGPRQNPDPPIPVQTYKGVSETSNLPMITGSSLTLAKMLRAEKRKQQAKMHKKKLSAIIK